MDADLIAYLDQRFGVIQQQFGEVHQQFDSMQRQFGEVHQQLDSMQQQFGEVHQQFDSIQQQVAAANSRLESLETEIRHTNILVEQQSSQVRTVAEGVVAANENLDRFRGEVRQELSDMRALVRRSYESLDRRVTSLERPDPRILAG